MKWKVGMRGEEGRKKDGKVGSEREKRGEGEMEGYTVGRGEEGR